MVGLRNIRGIMPTETVVHEFPLGSEHFVAQAGRSVQIFKRVEGNSFSVDLREPVKVFSPPEKWGKHWAWNIREDGSGIVFIHTA